MFDYAPEEEVLDEQLVPVLDSVTEPGKRVFEVLSTKEYKESKQDRYIELKYPFKGLIWIKMIKKY